MTDPNTGYGPSVAKVIDDAINAALLDVHTCLPAKVVDVDVVQGLCNVQPVLKTEFADETIAELPVINNVPIATYRAGAAFISLPLKVGDMVMLVFSERSLDIWQAKGGIVDPVDPRKFDLSDAIAYPGVYPAIDPPIGADPDSIVIRNNITTLTVRPDGKFRFDGAVFELLQTLTDLVDVLSTTTAGGDPLSSATLLENLKLQLESLKG